MQESIKIAAIETQMGSTQFGSNTVTLLLEPASDQLSLQFWSGQTEAGKWTKFEYESRRHIFTSIQRHLNGMKGENVLIITLFLLSKPSEFSQKLLLFWGPLNWRKRNQTELIFYKKLNNRRMWVGSKDGFLEFILGLFENL